MDYLAIDHEGAIPDVMDGFRPRLLRIDPRLDDFQHEEIVSVDQARIDHAALEVGDSATSGADTCSAGSGVNHAVANLSVSRPEQFPTSTTFSARPTAGIAITHSLV